MIFFFESSSLKQKMLYNIDIECVLSYYSQSDCLVMMAVNKTVKARQKEADAMRYSIRMRRPMNDYFTVTVQVEQYCSALQIRSLMAHFSLQPVHVLSVWCWSVPVDCRLTECHQRLH
jgi:hypothetical protein